MDYRVDTVFPDPVDYHRCEIEKAEDPLENHHTGCDLGRFYSYWTVR